MKFTDDYLLYLMAQASAAASAEFHGWLEAEGIPVSDWRIMASLYPDEALTVGDLATSCLVKQPTMTRMVDRLVAKDLVSRKLGASDRRKVTVTLTKKGKAMASDLVEKAKTHEAALLKRYAADPKDLKDLLRLLART